MRFRRSFSYYAYLQKLISLYHHYQKIDIQLQDAYIALQDLELQELAKIEISNLEPQLILIKSQIQKYLSIEDPHNIKNAILEIQAGAGGDESSLFVEILFTMYNKYVRKCGWNLEITEITHGNQGGYKNILCVVEGKGAYGVLKFESGSHKIQRISPTDSTKRIHTSAATVVVLPESETHEIKIKKSDVNIDTFRAGGAGGQHQNMTESGVRLTHLKTGVVVSIRDGRSQVRNLERAWKILNSRVNDYYQNIQENKQIQLKQSVRGSNSRSGCIRTYNFPQNRVTDHRINLTLYNLDKILNGNIEELLDKLKDKNGNCENSKNSYFF